MEYNLQKLEEWYDLVKGEKELTLKEAQELYKKMVSTTDELEKKHLKDELILGTMHVIYDQLKKSYLPYFPNGQIDVEDVLSVTSEMWIEFILTGKLLNINIYNDFFRDIFRKLNTRLYKRKTDSDIYSDIFEVGKSEFYQLLMEYLLMRRRFSVFTEQDFLGLFVDKIKSSFYYLFENIYQNLENQGLWERKDISLRQLNLLLSNFIESYINSTYNFKDQENYICKIQDENRGLQIENQLLWKEIIEMIDQVHVSKRNIEIFCKYHGLKNFTSSTYAELAREYHLSKDRTGEIEKKVRRRLKKKELKVFLEDLSN